MQEKLENVHFHITIKHCCVTVEKHLVFDGFLFFTGPNPKIVIFSKIMIKIVKVSNVMIEKLYNLIIIQFNAIFSNDERFV